MTNWSRPTFVSENGPGGVSVGALNPIAPPVMTTVVVPSAAKVIVPVPAGSRTEVDSPVSRFVITHVDGVTRLEIRTTSPLASKNVNC